MAAVVFLAGSESVQAADFTVTKTADTADGTCDADCSLREAIGAANAASGPHNIALPAGTYTLTIAGAGEDANATGDLDYEETTTINGSGSATTIIDGGDIDRVFHTVMGPGLTLNGVTVQNGDAQGSNGGGISSGGQVTLNNSTLTSNEGDQGAGIEAPNILLNASHVDGNTGTDQGGGLWWCCSAAAFTITDSTVDNNFADDQGGGVFQCCGDFTLNITNSSVSGNEATDQGGGVFFCCGDTDTNITITGSTIDNNTAADQGGGFFYCCGGEGSDTIDLVNSSFSGNDAASDGGGIFVCCTASGGTTTTITGSTIANNTTTGGGEGGGIYVDGDASITNSTIHNNTASDDGGGIMCGEANLSLTNVTITDNTTQVFDSGGGVNCSEFEALNTIIAGNVDTGGVAPDCIGTLNSLGNNLIQDVTGCTIAGDTAGNITGVDPALGDLADNGGPTLTRAVNPGTPAYNTGRNAGCPATDQRGVARPQEGTCEIGAYEFQVITPSPSPAPGTPTQAPAALPPTGGTQGDRAGQVWLIVLATLAVAAVAGIGTFSVARRKL
jgi:CSLREA domain-containing protein